MIFSVLTVVGILPAISGKGFLTLDYFFLLLQTFQKGIEIVLLSTKNTDKCKVVRSKLNMIILGDKKAQI